MYTNYEEMLAAIKLKPQRRTLAVAAAGDKPVIDAALHAEREGIARPIFVGDRRIIMEILEREGIAPESYEIVQADAGEASGQAAASLVKSGEANILMKGLLETKDLLRPVLSKENDLRTGKTMSHMAFHRLKNYHKFLICTDGAMVVYPSLEDKKNIIENTVSTLLSMGYDMPKIACLAGIEKVNPKMKETVEADALKQMNRNGDIKNCIIDGPLSYDVAMSRDVAEHKGADCPRAGDYDVLLAPDLHSGNILGKCWSVSCNSIMAGIIVGARAPIVLTSRGSTAEEKFNSIALAALAAY